MLLSLHTWLKLNDKHASIRFIKRKIVWIEMHHLIEMFMKTTLRDALQIEKKNATRKNNYRIPVLFNCHYCYYYITLAFLHSIWRCALRVWIPHPHICTHNSELKTEINKTLKLFLFVTLFFLFTFILFIFCG